MKNAVSILVIFLSFYVFATTVSAENYGKIRNIDRIAGNGFKWDYVLLFSIRKSTRVIRASADVERQISSVGDTLVRIGSKDGCVIATILTKDGSKSLITKYAASTRYGEFVRAYDFNRWNHGVGNKLAFEEVSLRDVCS